MCQQEEDRKFYPRILIVAREPFNLEYGCGITLTNLFKGWPKSSIMSIYWDTITPDNSVCSKHIKLPLYKIFPFNLFMSDIVNDTTQTLDKNLFTKTRVFPRRIKNVIRKIGRTLGLQYWLIKIDISDSTLQEIIHFKPEIVYCVASWSMFPYDLTTIIRNKISLPLAIHVYDDWITIARSANGLLGSLYSTIISNKFTNTITSSCLRMAIGEQMGMEYTERYGLEFLSFQNAPDPELWISRGKSNWDFNGRFTFRFIGTIYLAGNLQALINFCEAIDVVNQLGVPVSIEIHGPASNVGKYTSLFSKFDNTFIFPVVQNTEDMASLYGTSDALLLAHNGDLFGRTWMRLSMPTKLPSSLLSGSPIFVFAPSDSALATLIRNEDIGHVIAPPITLEQLATEICKFVTDRKAREAYACRAREISLRKFSGNVVRPKFQEAIRHAMLHENKIV